MSSGAPGPNEGANSLTLKGGGWVILLAAALVVLLLAWSLLGVVLGHRPIGDGRTLESYKFDLSTLLVPREDLRPSGNPRGFLPSLDMPEHLRGAEVAAYNEANPPKYVVSSDRVLGIVIGGQPHAWPLSLLNVHEVVNDVVAGVAVAATYSPLCDAAIVFDRTVEGTPRLFEVSGLLVDSNLVFYDKPPNMTDPSGHVASLFLQLQRRAVAGPLAARGIELTMLPGACITTWTDWLKAHPDTTIALRDAASIRRMKEISYARYFLSPQLEYPAAPLPSDSAMATIGLRLKSPMMLFESGGRWRMFSVEAAAARAKGEGAVEWDCAGQELRAILPAGPAAARLERLDGTPLLTIPCLYFAAESVFRERHPGLELVAVDGFGDS